MKLDSGVLFAQRYDIRDPLWLDGPHAGWLAYDRTRGGEVVINVPYGHTDVQLFLQRVHVRARLCHRNLIPVLDHGSVDDGTPFFADPYFKATALNEIASDLHTRSGVTLVRIVDCLLDACRAVAFLHTHGFLHLDLDPSNVLVPPGSREVFLVRGHPSLPPVFLDNNRATAGIVIGSPGFTAPERGNPEGLGVPDARTDVYGLGAILFSCIYNSPPIAGKDLQETFTNLMAGRGPMRRPLPRLAKQCSRLAQALEPVCMRALEYDRAARQPSVTAFIDEIEMARSTA